MGACFCTGLCKITGSCGGFVKDQRGIWNIPDDGFDFYIKAVTSKVDVVADEHRSCTTTKAVEESSSYHQLGRKWVKVSITG